MATRMLLNMASNFDLKLCSVLGVACIPAARQATNLADQDAGMLCSLSTAGCVVPVVQSYPGWGLAWQLSMARS